MSSAGSRYLKLAAVPAAFAASLLAVSRPASADVTLLKSDSWEVFTTGRMSAFFSYGFGDAAPVAQPGENIPLGAGLDTGFDVSPGGMDAAGNTLQGTFKSMRLRNGFVPQVLGFGLHRKLGETGKLTMFASFWATIETESTRKTAPPVTYLQEAYAKAEGDWGSLTAGRALDLFSRGATDTDFLYGHGYGLGFAGEINNYGPSSGLIGFGVIASFFSPGIAYATPKLAGLQLTAGIYDPAQLTGGYEATRWARPEGELTYDANSGDTFKVHLFANGEYQQVYKQSSDDNATSYGVGYGGRVEVGGFHLGASGHYGKGLGMHYALESSAVSVSQNFELRTFEGYSVLAQYATGIFDFNAGWGISKVHLLDSDKTGMGLTTSVPSNETGYYAGVVYHFNENFHFDVDVFHAQTKWRFGEKQGVNFINTGVTATW